MRVSWWWSCLAPFVRAPDIVDGVTVMPLKQNTRSFDLRSYTLLRCVARYMACTASRDKASPKVRVSRGMSRKLSLFYISLRLNDTFYGGQKSLDARYWTGSCSGLQNITIIPTAGATHWV